MKGLKDRPPQGPDNQPGRQRYLAHGAYHAAIIAEAAEFAALAGFFAMIWIWAIALGA